MIRKKKEKNAIKVCHKFPNFSDHSLFRLLYLEISIVQRLEISRLQRLEISRRFTLEISRRYTIEISRQSRRIDETSCDQKNLEIYDTL